MDRFNDFIQQFDITQKVTDEEVQKTVTLLQLYTPLLNRAANQIDEIEEACYESRRQSISDFINLAIDYDRDNDRKHIAERLADMGHTMELMSILEDALMMVKKDPKHGELYYKILHARYFDAYCRSNEDAFLTAGVPSSTYYRNIKKAIRLYAAYLWCVIIPDLVIRETVHAELSESESGSRVGVPVRANQEVTGSRVALIPAV